MIDYNTAIEKALIPLPHKMQVRFALYCANDVKHLMIHLESLKALEIIALWLEDKATSQEVKAATYDRAHADDASNAAIYTAYCAAQSAIYAAQSAIYAATYAVSYAAKANKGDIKKYYDHLQEMIQSLTEVERLMYNLEEWRSK